MSDVDLLVVSPACLTAINRAPYRELADMGWRVELVVPDRIANGELTRAADPAKDGDPPLHLLPMRGTHPRLYTLAGIGRLLRARRPRIVLVDLDPGSRLVLEIGAWTRTHGAHLACISCDNMPRTLAGELAQSPSAAARFVLARGLATLARAVVEHVFVLSSDIGQVIRSVGFRGDQVTRVPLGFDPRIFRPDPAARARIRSELGLDGTVVAYFGRLVPQKGVHLLIDALAQLKDRDFRLLLDAFGEYPHPYQRELEQQIAAHGLGDRVAFFDAAHGAIAAYMNAADVVVVPSVSSPTSKEQYGRVAPEAMACDRFVIVSDSGALPEVVGDAAVVIPENDVPALVESLRRAIDEPELRAGYVARARAHALAEHSIQTQAARMDQVFRRWGRGAPDAHGS